MRIHWRGEYQRDSDAGLDPAIPVNYFPDNDLSKTPGIQLARGHGHLLYANWLNYCVYQITPYDLRCDESDGGLIKSHRERWQKAKDLIHDVFMQRYRQRLCRQCGNTIIVSVAECIFRYQP